MEATPWRDTAPARGAAGWPPAPPLEHDLEPADPCTVRSSVVGPATVGTRQCTEPCAKSSYRANIHAPTWLLRLETPLDFLQLWSLSPRAVVCRQSVTV
jgi:hypothetical protein